MMEEKNLLMSCKVCHFTTCISFIYYKAKIEIITNDLIVVEHTELTVDNLITLALRLGHLGRLLCIFRNEKERGKKVTHILA